MTRPIHKYIFVITSCLTCASLTAHAKGGGVAPGDSIFGNALAITLLVIILILLLAILLLSNVVLGAMDIFRKKMNDAKITSGSTPIILIVVLSLSSSTVFAGSDDTAELATTAINTISGLSKTTFYVMVAVIGVELAVLFGLLHNLRILLGIERKKKRVSLIVKPDKPRINLWERFNRFKPLENEDEIQLEHNYDGITELDNRLPPWWLYGFYVSIVFSCIYLWRYQVTHSAPSSIEEYAAELKEAELKKTAYLALAANNIDETTVVLLRGKQEIESGKNLFQTNCSPCHGKAGEGVVGPNLTDDFWLHGGNIKDVFKTIKYGIPEKGMRSWKDDFSPVQIAELSSFIKSLRGSNPPNAKEKQGDLYVDNEEPKSAQDSTVLKKAK